ncbi:cupin [Rhizobium sp. BR 362]|uniref:cupin n=1 Tax=Rhizobium sp. BR 362 TaxID=3040670 RepID=UPI002F3EC8A7
MKIEKIFFQPSDWVPNNQQRPVLVYRSALPNGASPADFEGIFAANEWSGIWKNGVFDYQHYHSGAHEVLGIGCGSATLLIGGPGGQPIKVSMGDCLILPAGTGHRNLGCSSDFEVVGAYPKGQYADIQTAAATRDMLAKIASLPVPDTDPIHGSSGGLLESWR